MKNHDAISVVVNRITKSAHFIPILMTMSMNQLVKLYMDNIVKLHDTPISIVSEKVPRSHGNKTQVQFRFSSID